MGQTTIMSVWESLPNWHKAKKEKFPLYRATNDTFLDTVRTGSNSFHMIYIVLNECQTLCLLIRICHYLLSKSFIKSLHLILIKSGK